LNGFDRSIGLPIWEKFLSHIVIGVEDRFDLLKYRLRERLGGRDPLQILPYRGFGTQEVLYLKGRVLEDKGIKTASERDSLWDNLVNMYKRFNSKEVPYAQVSAAFQHIEQRVIADEEGFFDVWIRPPESLPPDRLWHKVKLKLLEPRRAGTGAVEVEGDVLVPPPSAEFGVISDVDDTVVYTNATHWFKMARTVFLNNSRTRLPYKGAAAFYRALIHGSRANALNPLFFISSSPWNIYDLLSDFFRLQDIPLGPLLLRDWGITEDEFLPIRHDSHKIKSIHGILDLYSDLPFILVGDSGQEDPEIYREVVAQYPGRILAVYIRNVNGSLDRADEILALAAEVSKLGSTMVLAENTYQFAQHAVNHGWISPDYDALRYFSQ
jgi:phosphatidate phosphatase APP1